MGWLTYHKPVGVKAVDSIKDHVGAEWWAKHVVASSATREAVFLVVRRHEPDSTIYVPDADGYTRGLAVFKIGVWPKSEYNFGYKDMTESMGPCGCEAPVSILDQCSPLREGETPTESSLAYARSYRERSRALAAAKAFKRGLKPGKVVTLREALSFGGVSCQRFTVERCRVRGRRGISTVFRATDTGALCSIRAADLRGATVAEA
jgi:hypothetical protein